MDEHVEWRGGEYDQGLDGQSIAIVGFSHWGDADTSEFTNSVIENVLAGDGHALFTKIRSYFGYADDQEFWPRVVFFNTLPTLVGREDDRYRDGTKEQRDAVPDRVRRILDRCEPDKVVVFTRKGWNIWPKFSGSHVAEQTNYLPGEQEVEWGTYVLASGKEVLAFGLVHPQYAKSEQMTQAVQAILAFQVATGTALGEASG